MAKQFGLYIVLGMIIGAIFGASFGPVMENQVFGIFGGAVTGIFIGWFIAAAVHKKANRKRS